MCKASELIEYLQTLDPDTEVEVLRFDCIGYGHTTSWHPLDLDVYSDNKDYHDWSDKPLDKGYGGKKVLFLGES
jgi:hypothetical protein